MKNIIKKWYQILEFPSYMDEEFYQNLEVLDISYITSYKTHDYKKYNGFKNLAAYLYYSEELKEEFEKRSYPYKVLVDSLKDLMLWSEIYYRLYNKVGLEEFPWCTRIFNFTIFRFGRLELGLGKAFIDIPELNIKIGDNVVQIHIPRGKSLSYDDCYNSFKEGVEFLNKYYKEFDTHYLFCFSWLLDDTLKKYLKEDANILMFQKFFTKIYKKENMDALRFTVRWNINYDNYLTITPPKGLPEVLYNAFVDGEKFYETYGYIDTYKLLK